ncbi:MAG: WG repeat-containing protein [Alistipes sp.]|nr:WG repeat-containing protein [Alistipes sp.]
MNHDVFISYSSKNSAAAQAICHELEDNGIKCWMAPRDIPVGAKYASVITKAIVGCRIVVLVFSDDSARSPWVESEINFAFSNRKTIVPYKIDTANIEDYDEFYLMLNNRRWFEAYPDYKICFKELVTIVAQTLGRDILVPKSVETISTLSPTPTSRQVSEKQNQPLKPHLLKRYLWLAICALVVGVLCFLGSMITFPHLKYENVGAFSEGLAVVELNGKYGYIDKTGKEVISLKYEEAGAFEEGLAVVVLDGKMGYVNKSGKEIGFIYDEVHFRNGFARVKLNDKYGFVDKNGNEVTSLKYDDASFFSEGLAMVKLNGKWGFIDKTGKEIIPLKYDDASFFSEGLAKVNFDGEKDYLLGNEWILKGGWGFIDKTGKEVIPLKYDYAWDFEEGLAAVELNEKWGFIDKTGKEVIPLKYDYAASFSEGLAMCWGLNDKCGFIDKTGKEVIPLTYDDAGDFYEGLAAVELNGKWGFIDKAGKKIIPLKYDKVSNRFFAGEASVCLNNVWFKIDKNGNRIE